MHILGSHIAHLDSAPFFFSGSDSNSFPNPQPHIVEYVHHHTMAIALTNLGRFVFGNTRRATLFGLLLFLFISAAVFLNANSSHLRARYDSYMNPEPIHGYNPSLDPLFVNVAENFPSFPPSGSPPEILAANHPPPDAPSTPLFIGFTRNWLLLQQSVVSYIAAGWPATDIYVVDNSGTMDSNKLNLLSLQNPFFVNCTRLDQLGVHVLTTPALLSFSQLQNYFLWTAIEKGWDHYWWSHMDSVVVSWEDRVPYMSLHQNILKDWHEVSSVQPRKWGLKFFRYDRLALVNVVAYKDVGGWDAHIPFYNSDCDFHGRLIMRGWTLPEVAVGHIFDVGGSIPDLIDLFPASKDEELNSPRHKKLLKDLGVIDNNKHGTSIGRNFWQSQQRGGKGEPFYKDPAVSHPPQA